MVRSHRVLILCTLLAGCHLPELLSPRPPAKEPEPQKCYANVYWVRLDPVTLARIDSTWAGSIEIPCKK